MDTEVLSCLQKGSRPDTIPTWGRRGRGAFERRKLLWVACAAVSPRASRQFSPEAPPAIVPIDVHSMDKLTVRAVYGAALPTWEEG
jgi:hypothetical protein